MNILAAWQRGYTGKNVVVTILDDGIERNHPDLLQNYVSWGWMCWGWMGRECSELIYGALLCVKTAQFRALADREKRDFRMCTRCF